MTHYDEQFEKDILEASINIRNEHKADNIQHIYNEEDLKQYLDSVDKLKTDYIVGDVTEEQLLEGITPAKAHADMITDPWHPLYDGGVIGELVEGFPTNKLGGLLKETAGKAKDARYCYLEDIARVAFDHGNMCGTLYDHFVKLGEYLAIITIALDDNNIENAQYYCSEALNEIMEFINISQVIGVRADALNSGKYTVEGYREPIDTKLLMDAAARHFLKILFEDEIDNESGFRHEAHIAANMIMIHTQLELLK